MLRPGGAVAGLARGLRLVRQARGLPRACLWSSRPQRWFAAAISPFLVRAGARSRPPCRRSSRRDSAAKPRGVRSVPARVVLYQGSCQPGSSI